MAERVLPFLGGLVTLGAALAPPALCVLAYRGWQKHIRKELPYWRSVVGIASVLVTFADWFGFALLACALLVGLRTDFFSAEWTLLNIVIALLGTAQALALKGVPRVQAAVAGSLMLAVWTISFVVQ